MALDNVRRDPAVFNEVASVDGLVWVDKDGDRRQDIAAGEITVTAAFKEGNPAWERLSDADRLMVVSRTVAAVNQELPRALRMGPSFYRAVKAAFVDLDDFQRVVQYHATHPGNRGSEELILEDHYNYLIALVSVNEDGTKGNQPAEKKALLGFLFAQGALVLGERDGKPVVNEDMPKVQKALAELHIRLKEMLEEGSREKARDFLGQADSIPPDWDRVMVPYFRKIEADAPRNGRRINTFFVILGRVPRPDERTAPMAEQLKLQEEQRQAANGSGPPRGCSCALGARP